MKKVLCTLALVFFGLCGTIQAEDFDLEMADMAYSAHSTATSYRIDCLDQKQLAEDAEQTVRDLDDYWMSLGNSSLLDPIINDPSHPLNEFYVISEARKITGDIAFDAAVVMYNEGQASLLEGDTIYAEHPNHGGYEYVVGTGGSYSWVWNPCLYCPEGQDCPSEANDAWLWAMLKCGGVDWPLWEGYGPPWENGDFGACGTFYEAFKDYQDVYEFWSIMIDYMYEGMNAV